jgi:glycosyltransferase involved in cell wall biosynthesis
MEQPLVSVVIACYNCEKYVELAVRSIIEQTYKNLEILIIDDCSTDNSYTILKQLTEKDNRIILMKNETNLKLAKNLNNMISIAKGKYIARMDADDISLSERIEKQVVWMEAHPEYAVCGTHIYPINSKGKKMDGYILPSTNEEINRAKYFYSPFAHPSVMIRKYIAVMYKYDEHFSVAQDYELWFRILKDHKGYNLDKKLLYYRVFSESVSFRRKLDKDRSLIAIFAANLTNGDENLAQLYVDGFIYRKIIHDSTLNVFIKNLLNTVNDSRGYNFHILLLFFIYFLNQKELAVFMTHLSLKENCKFLLKLIPFTCYWLYLHAKRKIYWK